MLSITFAGWAQCRLATDPDPYDEPRGVSGYMWAYSGEVDLDRIIRFQAPPFQRTHTPEIGVSVTSVKVHGNDLSNLNYVFGDGILSLYIPDESSFELD